VAKKTSRPVGPDKIPASINPHLPARQRRAHDAAYYLQGILAGDRVVLSQAITLVESTQVADQVKARQIVEGCLPHSGQSFRLGITGVPGVGKSTFIETFGLQLVSQGYRVAVLAVDPTSQLTHGSILGDKTRMGQLSVHPAVYIRPSPAGEALGGVAAKTRELMLLCEAAGYNFILVETVGVGQSEVAVHQLTDFFLLLLLPGGGDELQGIKRGVVEMADLIAVNKADEDRELAAQQARATYQGALHLFPAKPSGWIANAVTCSALTGKGIAEIIHTLHAYEQATRASGYFGHHRQEQAVHWLQHILAAGVLQQFYARPDIAAQLPALRAAVRAGDMSPQAAVERLLGGFIR